MSRSIVMLLALLFPVVVSSQYVVPSINENVPYFAPEPSFNKNEKRAIEVSEKILERDLPSQASEGGAVEFVYGQGMPVVICSPLRLCDIALEVGENVQDVMIGDTRWKVQPSISGKTPKHQVHAIVKPSDVGLVTSLMISTDRRVYNVTLKSSGENYMPQVSFTYPGSETSNAWSSFIDEQQAKMEETMFIKTASAQAKEQAAREQAERDEQRKAELERMEAMKKAEPPRLGVDIDNLNFDYKIDGRSNWKPTRVFDDGIHTYVDLPNAALSDDVPVLVVSPHGGGNEIVNYRLKNNRYVIDGLTSRILLLRDVGRKQQRIVITRK